MGGTPRAIGVSSVDIAFPQLTFLAILLGAFARLLTERLRNDLIAMLIVSRWRSRGRSSRARR